MLRELPQRRSGEVVVRPARAGEETVLAELSAPFVSRGLLVPRDLAHFAGRTAEFLLATCGDGVVGCAGLTGCRRELVIYNLCVVAEAQGKGIGRVLVANAASLAVEHGYRALLAASTYSGNWFVRQGFSEVDLTGAPHEWLAVLRRDRDSRLYRRPCA
jgi:amino-acid N-acetyltransferase